MGKKQEREDVMGGDMMNREVDEDESVVGDADEVQNKAPNEKSVAREGDVAASQKERSADDVEETPVGSTEGRGKLVEVSAGKSEAGDSEIIDVDEVKMRDSRELFDKLYGAFQANKQYMDEGWTVVKLRSNSDSIRPLFREIEGLLELGGISDKRTRDKMLKAVLSKVREAKGSEDFFRSISKRGAMSESSKLAEFHDAFIKGLESQRQEAVEDDKPAMAA